MVLNRFCNVLSFWLHVATARPPANVQGKWPKVMLDRAAGSIASLPCSVAVE